MNVPGDGDLVEAVRKRELLWRPQSGDYHCKSKKKMAWEAVAAETNRTVSDAKARWKSMRDYHTRRRKPAPSGSGRLPVETTSWQKEMSFLDDALSPKPVTTNLAKPEASEKLIIPSSGLNASHPMMILRPNTETDAPEFEAQTVEVSFEEANAGDHDYGVALAQRSADMQGDIAKMSSPAASLSSAPRSSVDARARDSHPDTAVAAGSGARAGGRKPVDKLDTAVKSLEDSLASLQNPDMLFGQYVGSELGRIREDRKMEAKIQIMHMLCKLQSD